MLAVSRTTSLNLGRRLFQTSSKSLKSANDGTTIKPVLEAVKEPAKESFAKANPFAFQLVVATGKTMAADLMTQTVAEGKKFDEIDWKRNGIFVVFGFAYLGGFQYWLMINKYRQVSTALSYSFRLVDTTTMSIITYTHVFTALKNLTFFIFSRSYYTKSGSHQWIDLPS